MAELSEVENYSKVEVRFQEYFMENYSDVDKDLVADVYGNWW